MGRSRSGPAGFPPGGLPGLDASWSRHIRVSGTDGAQQTFHVLDTGGHPDGDTLGAGTAGTLLCLHGNPTWSYLWRRLLADAPPGWRVVAPDQLGMGYSQRLDRPRTLVERVDDLDRLTASLGLTGPGSSGPIVVVAHDWGGIISLGWALRHSARIAGLVLTNTAVHQPAGVPGPALIRLARLPGVRQLVCRWTPTFVRAATGLSRPALPAAVRAAFAAPYGSIGRRAAVSEFVADIPFADDHLSRPALDEIARGLTGWEVPTLILWGARDPVFGEAHLRDLIGRLPRAAVHRFGRAGHLLAEDVPEYADLVGSWLLELTDGAGGEHAGQLAGAARRHPTGEPAATAADPGSGRSAFARPPADLPTPPTADPPTDPPAVIGPAPSLFAALDRRAGDPSPAVVEVGRGSTSWTELTDRIDRAAAGLVEAGLRPGDRVGLLVPPSVELTVALYAVWRAGGAVVLADRGLGLPGLARALRGAHVDAVIGTTSGLLAARALRIPGRRIAAAPMGRLSRRLAGVRAELPGRPTAADGRADTSVANTSVADTSVVGASIAGGPNAFEPAADAEAAVLFTSGATGPAKGVRYRHDQLRAQVQLIAATYGLTAADRIVAAFAPFALYGPALGIASAVPDADVTRPASLTAVALAEAADAVGGTVVFASPAALRNVLATADALTPTHRRALARVRLVMSAGAPVPAALLRALTPLLPAAELHTPYGMTEALPVTDIDLPGIEAAGIEAAGIDPAGRDAARSVDGVCVGRPLAGVEVSLTPIDDPAAALSAEPGRTGEIWVRAAHVKDSYDQLWATDQAGAAHPGWHRTGDVGALDARGRLWIQGRVAHLIRTADGPLPPVGIERRVQDGLAAAGYRLSETDVAAVGVGPAGTAQVVVVLAGVRAEPGPVLAAPEIAGAVRAAAGVRVSAVLRARSLPVDPRHQSKIDRTELGIWAAGVLAGG